MKRPKEPYLYMSDVASLELFIHGLIENRDIDEIYLGGDKASSFAQFVLEFIFCTVIALFFQSSFMALHIYNLQPRESGFGLSARNLYTPLSGAMYGLEHLLVYLACCCGGWVEDISLPHCTLGILERPYFLQHAIRLVPGIWRDFNNIYETNEGFSRICMYRQHTEHI